jgi:hypothetical protein
MDKTTVKDSYASCSSRRSLTFVVRDKSEAYISNDTTLHLHHDEKIRTIVDHGISKTRVFFFIEYTSFDLNNV